MELKTKLFGTTPEGAEITKFTITNDKGIIASFINFGAIISSVKVPDRNGEIEEITLGFDTLEEYISDVWFFGATIGRYANRIEKGRFTLDGVEYQLAQNSPPSHLHGGYKGFNKLVWIPDTDVKEDAIGVMFSCLSADGEEGYPGNLSVQVAFTLNNQNELIIQYRAETDKSTAVNLTNHTYWNLKGVGLGNTLNHELTLHADHYIPTDDDRIPTGEIKGVFNTPMDFTHPTKIGARIDRIKGGGYNHTYVINKEEGSLGLVARVREPESERGMEVHTTEPGIHLYSGHFLDNYRAAGGIILNRCDGLCLEAQHYPNSVNRPQFPSTILRPGELYRQTTIHRFSTA
ncbi:MAG: galactose mutarotase [Proteobacteria bacterium]|nr:galactose mutarotase [Pseudomonadota bacterium]